MKRWGRRALLALAMSAAAVLGLQPWFVMPSDALAEAAPPWQTARDLREESADGSGGAALAADARKTAADGGSGQVARRQRIAVGAMTPVTMDGTAAAFMFSPPTNSVYDICLFPMAEETPNVRCELWQDGQLLGQGAGMTAVTQRLTAGAACEVRLFGEGMVRLEIARHALSRCCADPMLLDASGDSYSKAIARRGDVHWYALDAYAAVPIVLVAEPQHDGLALTAQLFDDEGRLLAEASRTRGGAFILDFVPKAGVRTYVRVRAIGGGTGLYALRLARSLSGVMPDRVALSRETLTLEGRQTAALEASVSPRGAAELIMWESSDPGVARVDSDGMVTGLSEGITVITAYAAGGVQSNCRVQVRHVAVTGITLDAHSVEMEVGDESAIGLRILPQNACERGVRFTVDGEGVVEVDFTGRLRAVGEGEARVTVQTLDGGHAADVRVRVKAARKRYRALLVGEQGYASTLASARLGSANSVAALRSMLESLSYDEGTMQVHTLLDASRDGVLAAIQSTFAQASEQDFSLFYITCHGEYADGMTRFRMYDGSVLTALELEQALSRVPGRVMVIADCCASGGIIGRASAPQDLLEGIISVFGQPAQAPVFSGSKYMILASAALDQDSFRLSFASQATETATATVLARALCEAGGWDIDRAARSAMRADADYDGAVTMQELFSYCRRRVRWYLRQASQVSQNAYVQTVQACPMGDATVLMQRLDRVPGL